MSEMTSKKMVLFLAISLLVVGTMQAQVFTTLHNFAGTAGNDGAEPIFGALVQGFDGDLYGMTSQGGINCPFSGATGCGEVFKITTGGAITQLYGFCPNNGCPDGDSPEGGLTLYTNGNLYGMTTRGGSVNAGTVFRITPGGAFAKLNNFVGTNGGFPSTTLTLAGNGWFYGITNSGGSTGEGAAIRVTPAGAITLLNSFDSATTGSAQGDTGALIQGIDGSFYGVNATGGSGGGGTVFKMSANGAITILHSFSNSPDGGQPTGTLAQGPDGNFYGTTRIGGLNNNSNGTVFKITPNGQLTILHSFCTVNGCPDGLDPVGGLILGTDGNFYGTTFTGGVGNNPHGTVFRITRRGALTTLHSFNNTDGSEPLAGLVQDTNGIFYGTTSVGGANDLGTVFSLSLGLDPFVKTLPTSGPVGRAVTILGQGFTGASAVSFNGTAAAFVVVSDTEITTHVPAGATTGFVTVTTPSRVLTSKPVPFRVP